MKVESTSIALTEKYRSPVYLAAFGKRSTWVRIPPSRLSTHRKLIWESIRLLNGSLPGSNPGRCITF